MRKIYLDDIWYGGTRGFLECRGEGTEKSENGEKGRIRFALCTVPTPGHVTIYLYLFGSLHVLLGLSRDLHMHLRPF